MENQEKLIKAVNAELEEWLSSRLRANLPERQ